MLFAVPVAALVKKQFDRFIAWRLTKQKKKKEKEIAENDHTEV